MPNAFLARLPIAAAVAAVLLTACGGGDAPSASLQADLISSPAVTVASVPQANASLLTHTMPAWTGATTRATTLLFVPKGTPPAGGWPVVAWAHGTTTANLKTCAPSLTLDDLDGGLTKEGFTSHYAEVIGYLVSAGYAVVAPDFEGLGPAATVPYPYFSSASESRSLIAGVKAARQANPSLSTNWMALGHSEGAHGVLMLQNFVKEAPELNFKGSVAYAPWVGLQEQVARLGALAAKDPANAVMYAGFQNNFVGTLASGLQTLTPGLDLTQLMGADMLAVFAGYKNQCVLASAVSTMDAVAAKGPQAFSGAKPTWADSPAMKSFLETNDPAVAPGFKLTAPTLVVHGAADFSVQEPVTASFVANMASRGSDVTYRTYPGADHGSIVLAAKADVLAYLAARFNR